MKKKWLTSVVLALCIALVASLVTACGKKKVTIELSQTTLALTVGDSATLTATTSNGKDVEWSSSDTKIATVSSRGGVTAQGAGTATITATCGKATATCSVTVTEKVVIGFTFTNAAGETLTEATVDRDGTLQLNAAASDNSPITSWESQDASIASVSSTGLVSGVFDGETYIVVKTATGQGTIKVTVVDNFQGEKYAVTDTKTAGKWYYHINGDGGRSHELTRSEYRGGVVTFGYTGNCNWSIGDVSLGIADLTVTEGWHTLKAKINASAAMSVSVNGTAVELAEGNNNIEVAYQQIFGQDSMVVVFAVGVNDATVVVSDYEWSGFTPVTLVTPTFTRDGNAITISTTDTKGIAAYQIGLFKTGETTPVFTQNLDAASGTLDTSDCEEDGTFIIRVRTVGNPGYTSSEWSAGDTETVTVANGGLTYNLINGGEASSLTSGKWEYWTQGATPSVAEYKNGTITYKTTSLGWDWYGTQLFRHYSEFATGDNVKISMTVKASHAGSMTVSGNPFAIAVGDNNIVAYRTQAQGSSTIGIQFAVNNGGTDYPNFPAGTEQEPIELTFAISNIKVETFDPIKLASATIAVDADNAFTITDDDNTGKTVDGYRIEIFNGETSVKTQTVTTKTGNLDVAELGAGSFTAKVTTLGHGMYLNGDASAASDVFTVTALAAPTITVDTEDDYAYTITDDTNDAEFVKNYVILVGSTRIEVTSKTGNIDISSFTTGTYDVKVKAVASKKFANSADSAAISVSITNAAGVVYNLDNAEAGDWTTQHPDRFGIFACPGYEGCTVMTTVAKYENGTVTITFSATGTVAWGLQLKYKNGSYVAGTTYSFDVQADSAMNIQVADGGSTPIALEAGVSQHLSGAASADFYLQVNITDGLSGTITISNVVWA